MKIEPKAGPANAAEYSKAQPSQTAQEARARAIAKISGGQSQQTPEASAAANTTAGIDPVQPQVTTQQSQIAIENVNKAETAPEAKTQEVTKTAAPKVDEALSAQYAQLARKEKALRSQTQELNRQKAEAKAQLEAERSAIKAEAEQYKQGYISKEEFLADPQSVISKFGETAYEQLTQRLLNPAQPQDPAVLRTIKALEQKVAELEGKQVQSTKTYEDQQATNYTQAVDQIRRDVTQLVKTDPDFETIKETRSVNDVVDLIERTFKEGLGDEYPAGTLLTVEQASQFVEEELLDQAVKIAQINKVQKRLTPAAPAATASKQQPQNQQTQQLKTLTNQVGAQKPMTSRERAIAAFHGQLKTG